MEIMDEHTAYPTIVLEMTQITRSMRVPVKTLVFFDCMLLFDDKLLDLWMSPSK